MKNILDFLNVYNFENKIRDGCNSDGGYVYGLLDIKYDCYVSAGIADE